MTNKLYVEFRLHFDPTTNQTTLHEFAEKFQEHIHTEWNNTIDSDAEMEAPECNDVTYEITMVASRWFDMVATMTNGDHCFASVQAFSETDARKQLMRKYPACIIEKCEMVF